MSLCSWLSSPPFTCLGLWDLLKSPQFVSILSGDAFYSTSSPSYYSSLAIPFDTPVTGRYTCTEYCTHTKWLLLFLPKQKNEKSPLPQFSNSAHYALLNSSQWQISTATSVDHMGAVWLCHCDCHQWWPCDCGSHSPYMWWSCGHCGPSLVQALLRRLILKIILIDGNEDVGLSESEAQLSHL